MSFNETKFSSTIEKLIKFKSSTTTLPIKDTSWEELIWAALVFLYGDDKVVWNSQSHEKSVDIKAKINGSILKISAKGSVIKNNFLTLSSYRLTTFSSLEKKLAFIKAQHNNFDFYLICARELDKEHQRIIYNVIKTPAIKLAPTKMLNKNNWKKTKTGYELKQGLGLAAKIVFKMSDQLWYLIPLNYFSKDEKLINISISIKELGKGLINYLKSDS